MWRRSPRRYFAGTLLVHLASLGATRPYIPIREYVSFLQPAQIEGSVIEDSFETGKHLLGTLKP